MILTDVRVTYNGERKELKGKTGTVMANNQVARDPNNRDKYVVEFDDKIHDDVMSNYPFLKKGHGTWCDGKDLTILDE